MKKDIITLSHGSGGKEMDELICSLGPFFRGRWNNFDNDSASLVLGEKVIIFTTDSFIVDPIFFPGGDIGKLAICGTINDLAVMGARSLGISIAAVIEEGFPMSDLKKIMDSVKKISEKTKIPIVTGDTKVMERGKIDKIVLNTSGVGICKKHEILTNKISPGDKIIISGGLGEHATALLSKRFDYETSIVSDSKPLTEEIKAVKDIILIAKDATRGGIAAVTNEMAKRDNVGMLIYEDKIPVKKEVQKVTEMLGIDLYTLASEGRFICVSSKEDAKEVEKTLQKFNKDAQIIGEIIKGDKVIIQTVLGKRILQVPTGRIVPRIC